MSTPNKWKIDKFDGYWYAICPRCAEMGAWHWFDCVCCMSFETQQEAITWVDDKIFYRAVGWL